MEQKAQVESQPVIGFAAIEDAVVNFLANANPSLGVALRNAHDACINISEEPNLNQQQVLIVLENDHEEEAFADCAEQAYDDPAPEEEVCTCRDYDLDDDDDEDNDANDETPTRSRKRRASDQEANPRGNESTPGKRKTLNTDALRTPHVSHNTSLNSPSDIFEQRTPSSLLFSTRDNPSQALFKRVLTYQQIRLDFISVLPPELGLHILSYLEPRDLLRAAQTCRSWQ